MVSFRCLVRIKGGPDSGHRGHRGRPGLQGGSLPGVGGARDIDARWRNVSNTDFKRVFGDKLTKEDVEDMFLLPGMSAELHAHMSAHNGIKIVCEWKSPTGEFAGRAIRSFVRDSEGRHAHNES